MNLETAANLAIPTMYLAFVLYERLRPARPLPRVSWWRAKGLLFFLLGGLISSTLPLLWMDFIRTHRLVDLESAGIVGGAAIGFVATQFFAYWIHRAEHRFHPLWRWMHQMHHSAERIDVFGAIYFHPLDTVMFAVVTSVVPTMIVGVRPESVLISGVIGIFYSLFQHANVRTPRWLGYIIQRPEAHSVHHGRGIHAYNYGDLPLWDMLFGTYRNPAGFETEAGFWDGASKRVGAMLIGRDVGNPTV